MNKVYMFIMYSLVIIFFSHPVIAEPDPNFHIYLLFGQSNMAGGCKEADDRICDTTNRIKILAFSSCQNKISTVCGQYTLNREMNKWYTAISPLHDCDDGIGIGDNFAKTLLDSVREDISIGLIPGAFSGQRIEIFKKENRFTVPDWLNNDLSKMGSTSIYDWIVKRCKTAQESGVIKGILFHQGESNSTEPSWVNTAKMIFNDLKSDLNLGDNLPIVIGELLQDAGACCAQHNPLVHQLANEYTHCEYVSSKGLKMLPNDSWKAHFSCPSWKEFGKRYAEKLLEMTDNEYIPRLGTTIVSNKLKTVNQQKVQGDIKMTVYSLDGQVVARIKNKQELATLRKLVSGKVYIASQSDGVVKYGPLVPFVTEIMK